MRVARKYSEALDDISASDERRELADLKSRLSPMMAKSGGKPLLTILIEIEIIIKMFGGATAARRAVGRQIGGAPVFGSDIWIGD